MEQDNSFDRQTKQDRNDNSFMKDYRTERVKQNGIGDLSPSKSESSLSDRPTSRGKLASVEVLLPQTTAFTNKALEISSQLKSPTSSGKESEIKALSIIDNISRKGELEADDGKKRNCAFLGGTTNEIHRSSSSSGLDSRSQYHSILRLSVPSIVISGVSSENTPSSRRSSPAEIQNTPQPPFIYDYSCRTSAPSEVVDCGNKGRYYGRMMSATEILLGDDRVKDPKELIRMTTGKQRGTTWSPSTDNGTHIYSYSQFSGPIFSGDNPEDRKTYEDYSDESENEDSLTRSPTELSLSTNGDNFFDDDELMTVNKSDDVIIDSKKERINGKMCFQKMTSFGDDQSVSETDHESLDDVVEAKRARMEAIVSSMRLSPTGKKESEKLSPPGRRLSLTGQRSPKSSVTITERRSSSDCRRPKRKRYTPKQHDSRLDIMTDEVDNFMQVDGGKCTPEKVALQQELRQMQDQLVQMKQKYSNLLGVRNINAGQQQHRGEELGRLLDVERNKDLSLRLQDSASKFVSCQLTCNSSKDLTAAFQPLKSISQGSHAAEDLQRLVVMLRAEIATGVKSLVDEIVKKFEERHKLNKCDPSATIKHESPPSSSPLETKIPHVQYSQVSTECEQKSKTVGASRSKKTTTPSTSYLGQPLSSITSVSTAQQSLKPPLTAAQMINGFPDCSLVNRLSFPPKQPLDNNNVLLSDNFSRAFFDPNTFARRHPFDMSLRPVIPLFGSHAFFPIHSSGSQLSSSVNQVAGADNVGSSNPVSEQFKKEPEQTEALRLVIGPPTKKKRTKVTDTRLSPRATRTLMHNSVSVSAPSNKSSSSHVARGRNHQPQQRLDVLQLPSDQPGNFGIGELN